MSEVRNGYAEVHLQDIFTAMMALDILIEKGRLNGKSMDAERLTLSRLKAAVDAAR